MVLPNLIINQQVGKTYTEPDIVKVIHTKKANYSKKLRLRAVEIQ